MRVTTSRCRLELLDGTLLWDAVGVGKHWNPTAGDLIEHEGLEYEVKTVKFAFRFQDGFVDPGSGDESPTMLKTLQTVTVELKP